MTPRLLSFIADIFLSLAVRIEARMAQNPDTGPTWEGSRLPHWRMQLVSAQPEAYVYRLHYGKGNKAIAKATRALGYLDVLAGDLQNIIRWSEHPYPFAEYAS